MTIKSLDDLVATILNLDKPWYVVEVVSDQKEKLVTIELGYPMGSTAPCPQCQQVCKIKDRRQRTWRHLSFMEYRTTIKAKVPRVTCEQHGVKQVAAPWSQERSRFTLSFEAFAIEVMLISSSQSKASKLLNISWSSGAGATVPP